MSIFAEQVLSTLNAAGHDIRHLHVDEGSARASSPSSLCPATISAITPGHLAFACLEYPLAFKKHRFRAAFFMWDVDVIPRRFLLSFRWLDELWVTSSMGENFLSQVTDLPIRYFPTPIVSSLGVERGAFRSSLNIGDDFLVGYQFDLGSSAPRKNAAAAIEIFKKAFPRQQMGARLILKTKPLSRASADWRALAQSIGARDDIMIIDEFWDRASMQSMYADLDCYLSPHRSEGYGLTVAEAVASGTFVISTDYGGPADFLSKEHAGMMPFKRVPVGRNPIYPTTSTWAEPDVDSGATLLREAYENRDATLAKGMAGHDFVTAKFSADRSINWINDRLNEGAASKSTSVTRIRT